MKDYDSEQVFNCDESGLQFCLLPKKTLAYGFKKIAEGRKKSKDRVTVGACVNVTESIKLVLFL